jgi:hypothetical protein
MSRNLDLQQAVTTVIECLTDDDEQLFTHVDHDDHERCTVIVAIELCRFLDRLKSHDVSDHHIIAALACVGGFLAGRVERSRTLN